MYCSGCGTQMDGAQRFCPNCGREAPATQALAGVRSAVAAAVAPAQPGVQQHVVLVRTEKSPGLAAVLSFFWTGLGQIYNGQVGKGIGFMVAYIISWWMMFVVIGFITTPLLWIWGMVDAYQTAEKINAGARPV